LRAALAHELRLLLLALQFLTRVPVPGWVGYRPEWLQACARHFPAVGLLVGGVCTAVWWAAAAVWPPPVALLLSMAAGVWLTGGFHEDGLADCCDGLGGAVSRERALAIMKDSRLGSYGALGLLMVLALKAAALFGLMRHGLTVAALPALLLGHTASRTGAVLLLWRLPYAGDVEHAKAKPMATQLSAGGALVALAWTLALAVVLVATLPQAARPVLAGLLACAASGVVCARWFLRRLGGFTGDTLGAAQQFGELALYLSWLAALR
jgi:adenosylcobinamide-GDP ribazoletransferase